MTAKIFGSKFFFWMLLGDVIGFVSIFLLGCGFNNAQIGMIVALACGISVILQPIVAGYADKPAKPVSKNDYSDISRDADSNQPVSFSAVPEIALWAAGVLYCILIVGIHTLNPLINALGTGASIGKRLNFGVARGIGWGDMPFLSYILGIVLPRTDAGIQPLTICLISIGLAVSVACFPFERGKGRMRAAERENACEEGSIPKTAIPHGNFARYKSLGLL